MKTLALTILPLVLLLAPAAALAPSSRPHRATTTPKTVRGDVSPLPYQDLAEQSSDNSAVQDATRSLNIRPFPLADKSNQFKEISVAWDKQQEVARPPPSEKTLVTLGCFLAVNSGFLNGLAVSGVFGQGMGVAAVTGAWTNSALRLSSGNLPGFIVQLSLIVSYFSGSFVNGLLHPDGIQWTTNASRKQPCTSRTLLGVAALVVAAGSLRSIPLLAAAIGLQNSWTSMLVPGNLLRTAHFSGITSDIGTKVGQLVRLRKQGLPADFLSKLAVQSKLLGSFFVGGVLSVVTTTLFGIHPKVGLTTSAALLVGAFCALKMRHYADLQESFRSKNLSRLSMLAALL